MPKYKVVECWSPPDEEELEEDCKGGWRLVTIVRHQDKLFVYFEKVDKKNVKS